MAYDLMHRSAYQDAVLDGIIETAAAAGDDGVVALDLDGCLFDNRHRQVQILRTWAARRGETRLAGLKAEHFADWSMKATFQRLGLPEVDAEELARDARGYWFRWFFDDPYVVHDLPMPGAPGFARAVAQTGVRVVYLTGRGDKQRPATLHNLRRFSFPIDEDGADLLTKPDDEMSDEEWKILGFEQLTQTHRLAAFVDNEPTHLLNAARLYSEVHAVWVDTDHSPRPARMPEGTPTLRAFLRSG